MKINLLTFVLSVSAALIPATLSAEIPTKPAASFEFTVENNEPLYQTSVPAAVYQHLQTFNLRDISITNGKGETVPYSVLPYQSLHSGKSQKQNRQTLNFITLAESQAQDANAQAIQIEKSTGKTTINLNTAMPAPTGKPVYLIDLSENRQPITNITLEWQGLDNQLIPVNILASDNLKDWSAVTQIVLLKSRQNDQPLLNNSFILPNAVNTRYLQLRLGTGATGELKLSSIATDYQWDETEALPYQWTSLGFLDRRQYESGDINLAYELDGRYPVSQLKITLPEDNTITQVTISTKNTDKENWRYLTSAAIYRMQKNGRSTTSPDISIPVTVARYWQLQFNETKGGIGKDNPSVTAGWLPHNLIWNARGKPPFQLSTGNNPQQTNQVAITDLIPAYDSQAVLALSVAGLKPATDAALTTDNPAGAWSSKPDYKRWLLWAGLVVGVMMLAYMAYSLLRNEPKKPE